MSDLLAQLRIKLLLCYRGSVCVCVCMCWRVYTHMDNQHIILFAYENCMHAQDPQWICMFWQYAPSWVHLNKVCVCNSISQPTCYHSVDRYITICPMTSASYFWGLWESKSILNIPIMSLAPFVSKHLILINGWRQASWDRRAASDQSYYLPWCNLMFEAAVYLDNGRFGELGRCAFSRCSSYHYDGMTSHVYFSRKVQTSKRCRLHSCTWWFPSGC